MGITQRGSQQHLTHTRSFSLGQRGREDEINRTECEAAAIETHLFKANGDDERLDVLGGT